MTCTTSNYLYLHDKAANYYHTKSTRTAFEALQNSTIYRVEYRSYFTCVYIHVHVYTLRYM